MSGYFGEWLFLRPTYSRTEKIIEIRDAWATKRMLSIIRAFLRAILLSPKIMEKRNIVRTAFHLFPRST